MTLSEFIRELSDLVDGACLSREYCTFGGVSKKQPCIKIA